MSYEIADVAPCCGFTTREMHVNDAEGCGLAQNAQPIGGSEFIGPAIQLQGIGAVRAFQGTSMREFGKQHRWGI